MGLEGTWVLKIVYPLIFALVPVGLFRLFKSKFTKEVALFSVFFFVSYLVFFTEIAVLARQMIGELFFILLFLTILTEDIKGSVKWLCFSVFSFGLVVSHYALSYIFLIFIFAFWLLNALRKRKTSISAWMLITFAVLTFVWYIYSSSSATFNDLLNMADNIKTNFVSDFLNPGSRGSQVLQATGLQSGIGTFWHMGGRYLQYATQLLIVIGLLSLLIKKSRSFFNDNYYIMSFFNMMLLAACIIVPNLATTFNATRFYHLTLFFLSPFCVVGGIDILRFLSKKRIKEKYVLAIVVLAVLIPYFLFQTDFVYEATREESVSLPLSSYRFSALTLASMGVIQESEVSGALWLTAHKETNSSVYIDSTSNFVLDYGKIDNRLPLSPHEEMKDGSYVYLEEHNVFDGIVLGTGGLFNVTEVYPNLNDTGKIYSNGHCEIYLTP
jgi:uncharacterized membrane protein